MAEKFRYDRIGKRYSQTRHEDPLIRERIHQALGNAQTVVNVGAGTGSYEPYDRQVVPVEPSDVMIGQRSHRLAPAICAVAGQLPLQDASVDAAMSVLSLHHWNDVKRGVHELRRVARGPGGSAHLRWLSQQPNVADGGIPFGSRCTRSTDLSGT